MLLPSALRPGGYCHHWRRLSVRLSVRPYGFPHDYAKVSQPIQFKPCMSISTGKDKNLLNFQTYPVIFDPLVAKKLAKLPTNMA